MLVVDLILGALIALTVIWGFWRGVTVTTLALAGFGAGAVLGARLAPLVLNGGLHSDYAPEVAIPGALVMGAVAAALVERLGLRLGRRLDRLGRASPVAGALLGGALGLTAVWLLGTVAIEIDSLRDDARRSAILSRLDAVLTPPGPPLGLKVVYPDPFPTFRGTFPGLSPVVQIVTHAPGVVAATRRVLRVVKFGCNEAGTGSGWIAADGVVVTNAHVAAFAQILSVQFRGARHSYPATPIWFDPKNDIALLRVPGLQGLSPLTMAPDARAGTAGALIGFPLGRWAVRPARLGLTSRTIGGQLAPDGLPPEFSPDLFGRLITDFAGLAEPGSSGSPVVDRRGHVLVTAFAGGSGGGFGVPDRFVRYALRHAGPQVGTGPCPPGTGP